MPNFLSTGHFTILLDHPVLPSSSLPAASSSASVHTLRLRATTEGLSLLLTQLSRVLCHRLARLSYLSSRSSRKESDRGGRTAGSHREAGRSGAAWAAADRGKGKAARAGPAGGTGHAQYTSPILPVGCCCSGLENMSDNLGYEINI